MASNDESFQSLLDEASSIALSGWDFTALDDRCVVEPLPWEYFELASVAAGGATRVLDIDTGGGELLSKLGPPEGSVALEPYPPNLAVATERLTPLGIDVRARLDDRLPADDASFDLVLNRHGGLNLAEVARVLKPSGTFITQQVGAGNDAEFNTAFGLAVPDFGAVTSIRELRTNATDAGLVVLRAEHASPQTHYLDVGAVVLQLRAVPWQVPGFDTGRDRPALRVIHDTITASGSFNVTSHRFLLVAQRSER